MAFPSRCCGGVPGGVHEGESLLSGGVLLSRGGIHTKQRLLGLGPKFIPPQLSHGGVGGGAHEDKSLPGGRGLRGSRERGDLSLEFGSASSSLHSQFMRPHPLQPYNKSKRELTFSSS